MKMSDLVRKVLATGGAVLYTIMPAKGVSANEVAKEFSKGKTPVVVVEDKEGIGRTVGKGNLSFGVEGGYESIDTEVTKGKATQQSPDGVPEAPFPPTEPVTTTTSVDLDALNKQYDLSTRRKSGFGVFTYGILDGLDISALIGGAQTNFKADDRQTGFDAGTDSGFDLAYGLRVKAVPVKFKDGLYLALIGSWLQGEHDNMSVNDNPRATVNTSWRELAARLEVGKRIGRITPYAGIGYSNYREDRKLTDIDGRSHLELEAKNPWSGFVGVEGKLDKKGNWTLGGNIQFGKDRQAYFISFQKRF